MGYLITMRFEIVAIALALASALDLPLQAQSLPRFFSLDVARSTIDGRMADDLKPVINRQNNNVSDYSVKRLIEGLLAIQDSQERFVAGLKSYREAVIADTSWIEKQQRYFNVRRATIQLADDLLSLTETLRVLSPQLVTSRSPVGPSSRTEIRQFVDAKGGLIENVLSAGLRGLSANQLSDAIRKAEENGKLLNQSISSVIAYIQDERPGAWAFLQ